MNILHKYYLIVSILLTAEAVFSQPGNITVSFPDTQVVRGESVWIPLLCSDISADDSVLSFQVIFEYDSVLGVFDSAKTENSITPEFFNAMWNFNQPGLVNGGYLNFANLNPIIGAGNLCYLRFRADESETGVTALSFQACILNGGLPESQTIDGSVTVTETGIGIRGGEEFLPGEADFRPVYPNPFNREVRIDFILPYDGYTAIGVYDIAGRIIHKLSSGEYQRGSHSLTFTPDMSSSGIIFFRLQMEDAIMVQRAVYVK